MAAQVTRYTSALTLQVLGNAKGVFTTALSIFIFRNPYTVTSVGGYLITVAVRLQQSQTSVLLHQFHMFHGTLCHDDLDCAIVC
jgi:hypothetical protein